MEKTNKVIIFNKVTCWLQLIWGWFCLVIDIISIISYIFEGLESGSVSFLIVVFILGYPFVYFGTKKRKLLKAYFTYYNILEVSKNGSIAELASITGTSQEQVTKNLNKLIYKKFFSNAYIDEEKNYLNIKGVTFVPKENFTKMKAETTEEAMEYVAIKCENCAAVSKIKKGTLGECAYCGTPLKG